MKKPLLVITLVIPCATKTDAERITDNVWKAVPTIHDAAIVSEFSMTDYAQACNKAGHREAEERQRYKTWGYEELETTPKTKTNQS